MPGVSLDQKSVEDIVKAVINGGLVVMGLVGGAVFSGYVYNQAGQERRERAKTDAAERKELLRQLADKDKRIDALHAKLYPKTKRPNADTDTEELKI